MGGLMEPDRTVRIVLNKLTVPLTAPGSARKFAALSWVAAGAVMANREASSGASAGDAVHVPQRAAISLSPAHASPTFRILRVGRSPCVSRSAVVGARPPLPPRAAIWQWITCVLCPCAPPSEPACRRFLSKVISTTASERRTHEAAYRIRCSRPVHRRVSR